MYDISGFGYDIRDVVRVRKTSYLAVGLLRLCYSLLGVSLIFGAFVLFMYGLRGHRGWR